MTPFSVKEKNPWNEPGATMLHWAGLLLIIIPGLLKLLSLWLRFPYFTLLITISIGAGVLILLVLLLLVAIELKQDQRINQLSVQQKNLKIKISNNDCECPSCGNRRIKATNEALKPSKRINRLNQINQSR
jgi:hypothetical protein